MKFSASFDLSTKIITAGVIIILLTALGITGISEKAVRYFPLFLLLFISLLVLVLPYGFSVSHYLFHNGELVIVRPFAKTRYPLHEIRSAEIIDPALLRWSWRTFGSGGLFGYYGTFSNKHFGTMTWYLTRRDRAVLITTVNNKRLALSPDDPEGFLRAFDQLKKSSG